MTQDDVFKSRTFVRDRRTWIATLILGAALWFGTTFWLNRHVSIAARRAAAPGDEGRLVALAFDRVGGPRDGAHLDRIGLREALRSLFHAGWQPVSLGEVRAAYVDGAPLPAKPFLLTFDEGYLSTYEAADPVLRELHWPAVMFLRTERQERRDVSFLFWDRLRRMRESGLWEVASGDPPDRVAGATTQAVPLEPPGSRRIAARLERPEVVAWAPRGQDPLVALGCADAPRRTVPWLGFVDDVAGAAATDGDPFRIPRLRVAASWTSVELLARMDQAVASPPPSTPAGGAAPLGAGWVAGEGIVAADGSSIRLDGYPRAELWIPAARWADDWQLTAQIVPGAGEFWVVQPDDAHRREWRLGGSDGALYFEVREPGHAPEVLAHPKVQAAAAQAHSVRLVKRGRGIRAFWDGVPITNGPIALPSRWRGKLGVVTYASTGRSSAAVSGLHFSVYPYRVADITASADADEIRRLSRDAESIAAISPPWASADGGVVRETPFDRDLLRILSKRFAWDVMPRVSAKGAAPGNPSEWAATLTKRAGEERFDGLALELHDVAGGTMEAWSKSAQVLEQALRGSGMRLVVTGRPVAGGATR